ncbi:chemotaxis protein CheW [Massilia norwichensis]|uniref:Chemotaxis protein CheW n=1 Tax=Massilia norwichensis TaxID=1442366 RepID=A0ABT2ABI7_9BURK|nr:chemotaxis protein CheW [Massilia norwichensis]MCS0591566.1 chemotaxis protein CheW [Massilia norwichensis]
MIVDDCWRRIGVTGDRSCAELERHIHCRNCAVYADAAQRNLQRPVEPEYREAWARELARPEPAPAPTDAAAMVFRIGAEWLAVPVALAATVAPLAPVHRLPHRATGALLGVVNVGGRVLPALSLAALLGIATAGVPAPLGRHTFERLLVLELNGQRVAVPVAEMHGILRYAGSALRPPAATLEHLPSPLLAGVIADGAIEAGLLDGALLEREVKGLLR